MNKVIKNVEYLLNTYGEDKLNTDKKLVLMYWREIDKIPMDKTHIDTAAWLEKSTPANVICDAKCLLDLRKGMEEERGTNK